MDTTKNAVSMLDVHASSMIYFNRNRYKNDQLSKYMKAADTSSDEPRQKMFGQPEL